jgi:hypothetical protein
MSELDVFLRCLCRDLGRRELVKSMHYSVEWRWVVDRSFCIRRTQIRCRRRDGLGIWEGMQLVSNAGDHLSIVEGLSSRRYSFEARVMKSWI